MFNLEGKAALVTGASGGIGGAIAHKISTSIIPMMCMVGPLDQCTAR